MMARLFPKSKALKYRNHKSFKMKRSKVKKKKRKMILNLTKLINILSL